jgi:PucR family transcriptional regulator, purine catabolism regulatory protein
MATGGTRSAGNQPGPFTVSELLEMECMKGSELLAGSGGLDRTITGLNIVEVPDVWRWLRGGELLFSSGFPWRENPARLADVLTALDRVAVSAIAFKLGQYLAALPDEVLATADDLSLPVLRLPAGLPYRDVIEPVYKRLSDVRETIFERSLEVKQKFTRFGLDDQSIEKIAAAFAREVSRPVKIYDWLDGILYVASPDGIATVEPLAEDVARSAREQLGADRLGRIPRIESTPDGPVLAAGLVVKHETLGAMVVEGLAEPPDAALENELSYAIELISFLLLKRLAVLQGRREAADLFFRSLLSDSLSNEEAAEMALTLGVRITQPCAVLIAGVWRGAPPDQLVERLHRTLEQQSVSIQRASESISRPLYPLAYIPPMIAPMLLPTTRWGRIPRLSSTRSTPMWASPLAPPPDSTSAVRAGGQV